MRKLLFWLSLGTATIAQAQKIPDPRPFAKTITAGDLKKHLYVVAGKEFEGRETATEGQRKAAAYIENDFRNLGLRPGNGSDYQLYYPVFQDSLESAGLTVGDQSFVLDKDFFVNVSGNYNAELLGSEVVFAGYGISDNSRDDYKGLDVKGRIVLVLGNMPPGAPQATGRRAFYARQEAAQSHGAAAVLIIQSGLPRSFFGAKGNMYLNEFKKVNYPDNFYVTDKVAQAILGDDFKTALAGQGAGKTYTVNIAMKVHKTILQLKSSDVLGFLEGTDLKDQIVVISAHYDHLGKRDTVIYYGADDDGSGTVSVLELAEAFAKAKAAGKGPRRSILFLANSGEEKGLFGSQYYSEHPTYPLEHTTVDLNIDMIGRIDPNRKKGDSTNYVYVVGSDKLSTDLKPISEGNNKKYTKMELDYKFDDPTDPERIYYRSDHYNFARKGVPIIFYFDGIHKDYHKPSDTPDKINYDIMEKRARLVFFTAWEMANRNDLLKRDIPLNDPGR
ncbi:MAG: M28 family peptidase [Bacteroidetes bacterium]|nr:M28 family peptidase [Bacteroidota bacterium]